MDESNLYHTCWDCHFAPYVGESGTAPRITVAPIRSRVSPDARPRAGPYFSLTPGPWLISSHVGPDYCGDIPFWCNLASPSSKKGSMCPDHMQA